MRGSWQVQAPQKFELARLLAQYAQKTSGLDQYAIQKFAEAFEVFPRTLADNAGLNSMDIISQLYAAHEKGHTKYGINIEDGGVGDITTTGIVDLLVTKIQGIKLAMDAVLTVLRVDQIIQAKPAGGPKMPKPAGGFDDDD